MSHAMAALLDLESHLQHLSEPFSTSPQTSEALPLEHQHAELMLLKSRVPFMQIFYVDHLSARFIIIGWQNIIPTL